MQKPKQKATRKELLCAAAIVSIMLATAVIDGSIVLAVILAVIGAVCAIMGRAFEDNE